MKLPKMIFANLNMNDFFGLKVFKNPFNSKQDILTENFINQPNHR